MPEDRTERERLARAVREGADCVRAGDRPRTAARAAAEAHGLADRTDDLLAAIVERVESETDRWVSRRARQIDSWDLHLHTDRGCSQAPAEVERPSAEEIARLNDCDCCGLSASVPVLEEDESGERGGRP